jgi:hypothetical protein
MSPKTLNRIVTDVKRVVQEAASKGLICSIFYKMGSHAMAREARKISIKDVVLFAAFIWAYQECTRSQLSGDAHLSPPLDEKADYLWEQFKRSGRAESLKEEHKKLFRFVFQKEFQTFSSIMSNERTDMIEQTELFLKKIGYDPEMRSARV